MYFKKENFISFISREPNSSCYLCTYFVCLSCLMFHNWYPCWSKCWIVRWKLCRMTWEFSSSDTYKKLTIIKIKYSNKQNFAYCICKYVIVLYLNIFGTGCSGKIVFLHNSLRPLPHLHSCKRPSKLSTQCECTVTPIGW